MQQELKPSWTLKFFLTISSLVIFAIGIDSAANSKGMELFNTMCLLLPFSMIYAWFSKVKRPVMYFILDLHLFWWFLLASISAYTRQENYYYISLSMISLIFYSILRRKFNYIKT